MALEIQMSVHKVNVTIFMLLTFVIESKMCLYSNSDMQKECCFFRLSLTDLFHEIHLQGSQKKTPKFIPVLQTGVVM